MDEFKVAWNTVLRWQLPEGSGPRDPARVLWFLPVVGLLLGGLCWLLAEIMRLLIGKPLLAGFVGAILIMGLYGWAVRGRRLTGLAELGTAWEISREEKGLPLLPGGVRIPQLVCLGWMLASLVAIAGLIAYSGTSWLVAPPLLAMTAFAEMNNREAGAEKIPAWPYWLIAAVALALLGIATNRLGMAVLAWLLAWIVGSGSIDIPLMKKLESRHWIMIALLELVVLWIGALAL